jgi:hypothetical protein
MAKVKGVRIAVHNELINSGKYGHKVQRDRTKYSRKGKASRSWL